jgi:paraquat-inducible protein B
MEQSQYAPTSSTASNEVSVPNEVSDTLGSAAAEFSKNVQEATGKLVSAAESFATMSTGLNEAINEVKGAAATADAALKGAEAAKAAAQEATARAESVQANIARDYGNLKTLMNDLQQRIGALAVLARPLGSDVAEHSSSSELNDESSTENFSSGEELAPAENAPSPAGWQGWQG